MDSFNEIKNTIEFINSVNEQTLLEARHDTVVKETSARIKQFSDMLDDVNKGKLADEVETIFSLWDSINSSSEFKAINPLWKLYTADIAAQQALLVCLDIKCDPESEALKFQKKIALKVRKSVEKVGDASTKKLSFMVRTLLHMSGISYSKIQKANPYNVEGDFIEYLQEQEKEFKAQTEELINVEEYDDGDLEELLKVGDMSWFKINYGYCSLEGDAMGHCGNITGRDKDEYILSLRKVITMNGETYHRPSLTFIISKDGFLGEMKGRGNDKPSEKYHRHIVELLKSKYVVGIRGGGYLPEHNFSVDDLSKELYNEVLEVKGESFMDGSNAINKQVIHDAFDAIPYHIKTIDIDKENNEMTITFSIGAFRNVDYYNYVIDGEYYDANNGYVEDGIEDIILQKIPSEYRVKLAEYMISENREALIDALELYDDASDEVIISAFINRYSGIFDDIGNFKHEFYDLYSACARVYHNACDSRVMGQIFDAFFSAITDYFREGSNFTVTHDYDNIVLKGPLSMRTLEGLPQDPYDVEEIEVETPYNGWDTYDWEDDLDIDYILDAFHNEGIDIYPEKEEVKKDA